MNYGIITLTKGGTELGIRLQEFLKEAVLYTPPKFYIAGKNRKKIDEKMAEYMGRIFYQHRYLIFIMATGIVIRAIAPYIKDKKVDPGVIVMDEKGKNVISLLSGHIGGANDLTIKLATYLGTNPVITTASDVNNKVAVDTLAMELKCEIEDYKDATKVTAHIVNGEMVGILSEIPMSQPLTQHFIVVDPQRALEESLTGLIIITNKRVFEGPNCDKVLLRPKNIVIGIGCRQGKSIEEILYAIEDTLKELNISPKSIKHIATVDVKENEQGILDGAKALGVPVVIIDREKIREVEHQFETSDFVKKTIGVGAVCEPVAILSSINGHFIQKKKTYGGITISVVKEGEDDIWKSLL